MSVALAQSWFFAKRELRNLARQPWWIAVSLAQPIIYLLLFAALFKRIVEIPGFGSNSYLDFFTPGVVVMTALFSGGWGGIGTPGTVRLNRGAGAGCVIPSISIKVRRAAL